MSRTNIRQQRFAVAVVAESSLSASCEQAWLRCKAFLDKGWRKKSLVDFIFMVGHWNREIGNAHIVDCQHGPPALAQEAGEQQGGDIVPSRVAALRARAQHRYLTNRLRRYRATNCTAGTCEACGWRTDWEAEEQNQPRTSCFYCRRLV